jgi:hypothetical protein
MKWRGALSENAIKMLSLVMQGPVTIKFLMTAVGIKTVDEFHAVLDEIKKTYKIKRLGVGGYTTYEVVDKRAQVVGCDDDYVERRSNLINKAELEARILEGKTGKPWKSFFSEVMDDLCCENLGTLTSSQFYAGRERFSKAVSNG